MTRLERRYESQETTDTKFTERNEWEDEFKTMRVKDENNCTAHGIIHINQWVLSAKNEDRDVSGITTC